MLSSNLRFEFGKNWALFLESLDDAKILQAENSLKSLLNRDSLVGLRFVDVGSGSGLFSLCARRLGADVVSFDYDFDSVKCTASLRDKYFPGDSRWRIEQGSALDETFLSSLGQFDIVYSWGVLHHTGDMWRALEYVERLVKPEGSLSIAIYNDQGVISKLWYWIKRAYNKSSGVSKKILLCLTFLTKEIGSFFIRTFTLRNPLPWVRWRERRKERGMSVWRDHVDWVGGYPFEVARPKDVIDFYKSKGYVETFLFTRRYGSGCCEYVFRKQNQIVSGK